MASAESRLEKILAVEKNAAISVKTLGQFNVERQGSLISDKDWGRDKTVQLFQYLITSRHRKSLHKERIIDRIWEDAGQKEGNRDFKVAMHGINKVLEPERKSRTEPKYIIRQGLTYCINQKEISIDVEQLDKLIALGNEVYGSNNTLAKAAYKEAVKLYEGIYLPNRLYEDWANAERERIQVLALGAFVTLGELILDDNPMESVRLAQNALLIDSTWEDAYRLQMSAYLKKGNRPSALKCYKSCVAVLDKEFGIEPLPETKALFQKISAIGK